MTKTDWIITVGIVLALLILIKFQGLKTWHAVLVFGLGFYFSTTVAGQWLLSHATTFFAGLGH